MSPAEPLPEDSTGLWRLSSGHLLQEALLDSLLQEGDGLWSQTCLTPLPPPPPWLTVRPVGRRPISPRVCTCVLCRHVHDCACTCVYLCCGHRVDVGVGGADQGSRPAPALHVTRRLHCPGSWGASTQGRHRPFWTPNCRGWPRGSGQGSASGVRAGVSSSIKFKMQILGPPALLGGGQGGPQATMSHQGRELPGMAGRAGCCKF